MLVTSELHQGHVKLLLFLSQLNGCEYTEPHLGLGHLKDSVFSSVAILAHNYTRLKFLAQCSSIPNLDVASQTITPLPRTSLLVHCSKEEAAAIRQATKREHRTISSFVLHSVLGRMEHQRKFVDQWRKENGGMRPPRV